MISRFLQPRRTCRSQVKLSYISPCPYGHETVLSHPWLSRHCQAANSSCWSRVYAAMIHDIESSSISASSSEAHARLLYESLEQYNREQKKRRRPSVILGALLLLFFCSACGITLAIVLMAKVVEVEAACLSRDLILFAGIMSLLYLGLHIKGARRDYTREGSGPPQLYGHYLHASALLFARLSIIVWIAALIATAILISKSIPLEGFAGKVPILNLLLCIAAM